MLNLMSGFGYRILIMATAFVVRTVFIRCLADEYLGVNGLYSSILSMLSLLELGFGVAMGYSMYQPIAEKDYRKLRQLLCLYKKVYYIVGTVILFLGLCLIPFLDRLIKDQPDIDGLVFYYILFLLNTVVSYWFFAYQGALLQADQKAYVVSNYSSIFNLIKSVLQIILLVCFHNYTVYLIAQMLCTIGQNIAVSVYVQRNYPMLGKHIDGNVPAEDRNRIFRNVKALVLSRISHVVLNSTDNIIISAFIGLNWVGLLSNFNLIVEAVTGVLTQITGAIQASLGNYFAKEDRESGYRLFCKVDFLNYWLYGFFAIALDVLLNPFIVLWIGDAYTLSTGIVAAIAVNFFVAGFMNTLWTFRSALGLFTQGQFRPLIVAALNIVLSVTLGKIFGVAGVLGATSLSRACVNLWYDPWLLHRYGFQKSVKGFYLQWMFRLSILIGVGATMNLLSGIVFSGGVSIQKFCIMTFLVALIPNAVLLAVFHRCDEFRYFKGICADWILHNRCSSS